MEYDSLSDLYDLEYTHDYDLPFWLSLAAREAGPLIEWGAGTGRIAVPLSTAGHEVTAVELSVPMVEQGKPKTESVEWIVGDMRDVDTGRRYDLAVCAFNSFLCLKSMDQALAFLRNASEHLVPGGLLGIEVSAFSPEELIEPRAALRCATTSPAGYLKGGSNASRSRATTLPHNSWRCACSTNDTTLRARSRTAGRTT